MIILLLFLSGMILDAARYLVVRCHLQTVADTSAYSGAVVQARALNFIAERNQDKQDLLQKLRNRSFNGGHSSSVKGRTRRALNDKIRSSERSLDRLTDAQHAKNRDGIRDSRGKAIDIARQNDRWATATVWQPGSTVTEFDSKHESRSIRYSWKYHRHYYRNGRRRTRTYRGSYSGSVTAELFARDKARNAYITTTVSRENRWMYVLNSLTGRTLAAYATAIPYGGVLYENRNIRPEYEVRLVRGEDVTPRPPNRKAWLW